MNPSVWDPEAIHGSTVRAQICDIAWGKSKYSDRDRMIFGIWPLDIKRDVEELWMWGINVSLHPSSNWAKLITRLTELGHQPEADDGRDLLGKVFDWEKVTIELNNPFTDGNGVEHTTTSLWLPETYVGTEPIMEGIPYPETDPDLIWIRQSIETGPEQSTLDAPAPVNHGTNSVVEVTMNEPSTPPDEPEKPSTPDHAQSDAAPEETTEQQEPSEPEGNEATEEEHIPQAEIGLAQTKIIKCLTGPKTRQEILLATQLGGDILERALENLITVNMVTILADGRYVPAGHVQRGP